MKRCYYIGSTLKRGKWTQGVLTSATPEHRASLGDRRFWRSQEAAEHALARERAAFG